MCQYSVFRRLVINRGLENQGVMVTFTNKYSIKRVQISAYNSKANSIVERSYRSILKALFKIGGGRRR
jgi:hypothetical protein